MLNMEYFEELKAIRNGIAGKAELAAELKEMITNMLLCANSMLGRVSKSVLQDIAMCSEYIYLNNAYSCRDGQNYSISYYVPEEDDITLGYADKEEFKCLEMFQKFLLKRYGFEWAYTQIDYKEEKLYLGGESQNNEGTQRLIDHLEIAFPDIEILI